MNVKYDAKTIPKMEKLAKKGRAIYHRLLSLGKLST
jgi:hypothetical protein